MAEKKGKEASVKLVSLDKAKREQPFTTVQATRILSRGKNAGWKLADDNLEFKDGTIRSKSDKGEDQDAPKPASTKSK